MKKLICFLIILIGFSSCRPKVVFDIPPLVGKDIDEVAKIMNAGKVPSFNINDSISGDFSINSGIYILNIEYYNKTRKIRRFSINSPKKSFINLEDILKLGNLDSATTRYYVVPDNTWNFYDRYYRVSVYPR